MDRLNISHINEVERILSHPSVIDTISDKDMGDPIFLAAYYLRNPQCHVVSPYKDQVFLFKKFNATTYEMHVAIIKGIGRKKGIQGAYKAAQYINNVMGVGSKNLITFISASNILSLTFAKMCGMKEVGILPNSYLERNNELTNMVILGAKLSDCLANGEKLWHH